MFGITEPVSKVLKSGRVKRPKPRQDTIISQTTARRLMYLQKRGLASFVGCRLSVARTHYKDFSGRLVRMPHGLIHGGV